MRGIPVTCSLLIIYLVVFAKLLIDGKNEGLHGILVRIRDNDMKVMPGVTVEDMGHKMGLNGVDNAKLSFDQVMFYYIICF